MNRLCRYLHSRNCTVLTIVVAAIMTYVAFRYGHVNEITGSRGTLFESPNRWLAPGMLSLMISLLLMTATAFSFQSLNKVFNFMRAPSALTSTLYVVMLSSLPMAAGQFYGGTLLSLVILAITALLFSCYADPSATRRVFLIFFILSIASLVQYAFMFYILVAIPGLAQMRILNFRSVLAMILGIISPVWILYGFGVIELSDIGWPHFVNSISRLSLPGMITVFTAVGLTMLIGFAAMCGNLMKILGYNAKFRAFNGFLSFLLIFTMLLMIIDYVNISVYFPLLCLTGAYQVAHYLSMRGPRSVVWTLGSIVILYLLIYAASYYFV